MNATDQQLFVKEALRGSLHFTISGHFDFHRQTLQIAAEQLFVLSIHDFFYFYYYSQLLTL